MNYLPVRLRTKADSRLRATVSADRIRGHTQPQRKQIAGKSMSRSTDLPFRKLVRLLERADALAQPGLVARGRVLVQRPLLDGLVEGGNRLAIGLLGGSLVALVDGSRADRATGCAGWRCWRGCARCGVRFGGRASAPKDDLPCLVRYLRVYREIFGWVRITYYRGATPDRSNWR